MTIVVWAALAAVTLAGAVTVLLGRDVTRTMLGLGSFLIGMAGLYAYYAVPFLAVAQVFVYVGGVLVLFLFAIMALRRDDSGRYGLAARFDIGAAASALALFALMVVTLRPLSAAMSFTPRVAVGVDALGRTLLGGLLPQFEAVGVLLLAALVAAITVLGEGGERS